MKMLAEADEFLHSISFDDKSVVTTLGNPELFEQTVGAVHVGPVPDVQDMANMYDREEPPELDD
jgi:hypothetical protein